MRNIVILHEEQIVCGVDIAIQESYCNTEEQNESELPRTACARTRGRRNKGEIMGFSSSSNSPAQGTSLSCFLK